MSFTHLDRYAERPSWLTRHTTAKGRLWIALAAAFTAGLMPAGAWRALLALAVLIAVGCYAARLPVTALAKRLAQALPFFLLPALALPFSIAGPEFIELGPFRLSQAGTVRAVEIVTRATLAVAAVSIAVSVTRATDLLNALDDLPLPQLVRSSLALGYRYVYLLNDELERSQRALRSRMGRATGWRVWRARGSMLAHLFTRAHDRGMRIHAAMLSRGYQDHMPTLRDGAETAPTWALGMVGLFLSIWLMGWLEVRG